MARDEYDAFVQELRDIGRDDLADEMNKFSNREMRKRIGYVAEQEKKLADLEAERDHLLAAPQRDAVLQDAGVDLEALKENPAALEILEAQRPETFDDEWAREMVVKYRLPIRS